MTRVVLAEGGNIFDDAVEFDQKDAAAIVKQVNAALKGTGLKVIPVGSSATPTPGKKSGDLDVIVDQQAVIDYFKASDAKSARKALNDYIAKKGLQTAQSGINVHVRVPLGAAAHQVDVMVTPNAEKISKFHVHDIPAKSPYKGVNKHLMIAILAKKMGYMWSAWQGLYKRDAQGKKAEFVSDDLDVIAKTLLGNSASAKSLSSVESILQTLPSNTARDLLNTARQDPNWREAKVEGASVGTNEWFRSWANRL